MQESTIRRALPWNAAPLAYALMMSALGGCEASHIVSDAGPPLHAEDAARRADDAGVPVDASTGCTSHADCEDGNTCTDDTCEEGLCWSARQPGCVDCSSDVDCDDGFICTIESCLLGVCRVEFDSSRCDCTESAHCDDGSPATADSCVDYRCVNERIPCTEDAACDDANRCTADRCEDATCVSEAIPGCGTTCPDRDRDGHGSRFCTGGDDCDDANPAVNPSATEICDDRIDNDCDGRVDAVDEDCTTGATTCAAAMPLVPGTPATGAVVHDGSTGMTRAPCGEPNYHTITISELSDVDATVTLDEPPPPTPVPGCPECTPDRMFDYQFQLFFETTCGDVATDLGTSGGSCRTFSNDSFFGGSPTHTISLRRVPPGTYTIEVQAQDFFGWMPVAIQYTVTATVAPSDAPACSSATPLLEGGLTSGRTGSGVDAFGTNCDGGVVSAEENLHSFTLAERRRVRLEAIGMPNPVSTQEPGLRVELIATCDPAAAHLACLQHTGRACHARTTMEEVLDAGTYFVVVEGERGGDHGYEIRLSTEPVGAACAGAPLISASGSFSGTTVGAGDEFRDPRVCGDGYGADLVYRVDVEERSRLVLDLIGSYPQPTVALFESCGGPRLAGRRGSARLDVTLEPGTYYAVVDGETASDEGGFVLNATLLPAAPAP